MWLWHKERHLKFRLPQDISFEAVKEDFDAGTLEVVVLQTKGEYVALPNKGLFLEHLVPIDHVVVNGRVDELVTLIDVLCSPARQQSDEDAMEDVVSSSPVISSPHPASSIVPETEDDEPVLLVDDSEFGSSNDPDEFETDQEEEEEIIPNSQASDSESRDEEDVEELSRRSDTDEPAPVTWVSHVSTLPTKEGHQTAEYLAMGDDAGEVVRFIREPAPADDDENDASLVVVKEIKKKGGRRKLINRNVCLKGLHRLIDGQRKKKRLFPTVRDCAEQAVKDLAAQGEEASVHTVRTMAEFRKAHTDRYHEAQANGQLDENDYFIR